MSRGWFDVGEVVIGFEGRVTGTGGRLEVVAVGLSVVMGCGVADDDPRGCRGRLLAPVREGLGGRSATTAMSLKRRFLEGRF